MTTLRAVEITEEQKARRKRLIALASEVCESVGEDPIDPASVQVAYSMLPMWIVMRVCHLKPRLDRTAFVEFTERFDAIMAEENASRRPS
jgi:hypothetical protein